MQGTITPKEGKNSPKPYKLPANYRTKAIELLKAFPDTKGTITTTTSIKLL